MTPILLIFFFDLCKKGAFMKLSFQKHLCPLNDLVNCHLLLNQYYHLVTFCVKYSMALAVYPMKLLFLEIQ